MLVYYNENDRAKAEWMRRLMDKGHLPEGDIDTRSITEVRAHELKKYDQCHFFAGIGTWAMAGALAGWSDRPYWTGSCPCPPFSRANWYKNERKGFKDERHLYPIWQELIAQRKPPVIFGEQVGDRDGQEWREVVQVSLEQIRYAFGGVSVAAASVGAPQIRQRLYWVAIASFARSLRRRPQLELPSYGSQIDLGGGSLVSNVWANARFIECEDGKRRPLKPRLSPMVDGAASRSLRIRSYGDGIVLPQAVTFMKMVMEYVTQV